MSNIYTLMRFLGKKQRKRKPGIVISWKLLIKMRLRKEI